MSREEIRTQLGLRAGRYRVFYTIDEERRVVQIDHVARLPWPWHINPGRR